MNGRPTSGTTGLGIVEVSGRSRVPSPAGQDQCLHRQPPRAAEDIYRPMPS